MKFIECVKAFWLATGSPFIVIRSFTGPIRLGLLGTGEVAKQAIAILNEIGDRYNVTSVYRINDSSIEHVISSMVENFKLLLVEILMQE